MNNNNDKIISPRELQRNYRGLVDKVLETGQAVYLGARLKPEVVLLDVRTFENLQERSRNSGSNWETIKARLEKISKAGKQGGMSLSKFVHEDRKNH